MSSTRDKLAVVLVPDGDDWAEFSMVDLKHPCRKEGAMFAFNKDKTKLAEVVSVDDTIGSWFVGDTIESDGRLQILTDFDPILLAIPYLRSATRSVPLDHLIQDDDFPHMEDLVNLLTSEKMQKIATSKGSADLNVWQWNEEKALEYMTEKVERLTAEILSKSLARSGNTASLNYVNSTKVSTNDQGESKRLAWQFLSDYLQDDLSSKVAKKMGIEEQTQPQKVKPVQKAAVNGTTTKSSGPKEDFSKDFKNSLAATVTTPSNSRQKALAKSATGSKNITSFFTKKS